MWMRTDAKSDIVPAELLEMGYTRCVVFDHKFCRLLNSSSKRMGIQFHYYLPSSSLVGKR